MKLVCDCGNEMELKTTDEQGKEHTPDEENGQYARTDDKKFDIYADHELVTIGCKSENCGKALYFFT
jgi:hypothetical protein